MNLGRVDLISGKPEISVDLLHRVRWPLNISADAYNTFKAQERLFNLIPRHSRYHRPYFYPFAGSTLVPFECTGALAVSCETYERAPRRLRGFAHRFMNFRLSLPLRFYCRH